MKASLANAGVQTDVVLLPEGTYYIVSNYGEANSVVRSDVRVRRGLVANLIGLVIEATGLRASIGEVCFVSCGRNQSPIAAEVEQYDISHLRRLDVLPGMTGLWQVEARQDPSFDSYISLDTAYVENWSLWLDMKILARTVGVVFSGTGS